MKDFVETNVEKKIENSVIEGNGFLTLIIPVKHGKIKEIKFEIKEKDLTEKEVQNNIMEFVNKIYWENEELKKKINELQIVNKKISNKLEETKKDLEQSGVKKMERINNLFKDSAIIKNDEKKMKNDWIDPYGEKNITSELLFRTSVNGDSASTFHQKCDGKGATITFIKTTNGKRIGGFTMIPWTNAGGAYKEDPEAFIFSLDATQKFV